MGVNDSSQNVSLLFIAVVVEVCLLFRGMILISETIVYSKCDKIEEKYK